LSYILSHTAWSNFNRFYVTSKVTKIDKMTKYRRLRLSRSFKVIDFGTKAKPISYFLW